MGCSGGLKRFAPPGIVKYEELAKDQPVNPTITERVKARKDMPGRGFPSLAAQPKVLPEGIAKPERDAMQKSLIDQRDALNAAMEGDRATAESEREDPLEAERDALIDAANKDEDEASRERGRPIRANEPDQE